MTRLRGHHVYYTFSPWAPANPYEPLLLLAQLCSALHWRKLCGPMELVCDQTHLGKLEHYNIQQAYNRVDVRLLDAMPAVDLRYWAFPKLFLARELARTRPEEPVVIFDTDLWFTQRPPELTAPPAPVLGFHREDYDLAFAGNPYVEPHHFLDPQVDQLDWSILPLNTALLYVDAPALVADWYERALGVIANTQGLGPRGNSSEIVFIEQRLLPTLAAHHGVDVATLMPVTYHTANQEADPAKCWDEPEVVLQKLGTLRHVWALKSMLGVPATRHHLRRLLLSDLENGFSASDLAPYQRLLDEVKSLD